MALLGLANFQSLNFQLSTFGYVERQTLLRFKAILIEPLFFISARILTFLIISEILINICFI